MTTPTIRMTYPLPYRQTYIEYRKLTSTPALWVASAVMVAPRRRRPGHQRLPGRDQRPARARQHGEREQVALGRPRSPG